MMVGLTPGLPAVTITRRRDVYSVQWVVGRGGYDGTGILTGNVLSVAFKFGTMAGVAVYEIGQGPQGPVLNGRWTLHPGNGQTFNETLTPAQ